MENKKPRKGAMSIIPREMGGASIQITIPKTLVNLMEIEPGKPIEIEFYTGDYGKHIAIWNHRQQIKEYNRKQKENGA